jgi:hypothetical protein
MSDFNSVKVSLEVINAHIEDTVQGVVAEEWNLSNSGGSPTPHILVGPSVEFKINS